MKDKKTQTIGYYDTHAIEWSNIHHGDEQESYWKVEMDMFHKFLPCGKVLEVGSGSGKDASALLRLGYDYVGTDASKGLLEIAQKRNPNTIFRCVAVQDLDFEENEFDGFWTAATLLHMPKNEIDDALKNIVRVVKPNGVGFISVKAGAGERKDVETGRWFSYYSSDGFKEILERNKLRVIESRTKKGEKDFWLVFFVKVEK